MTDRENAILEKIKAPQVPEPLEKGVAVTGKELAVKVMRRYDEEELWDKVRASDIPSEVTQYVIECLERGVKIRAVMKRLGIPAPNDRRWRKIISAVRQGIRVDSTAMFQVWINRNELLAERIFGILDHEMKFGEMEWEDKPKGLSMLVDSLNRLQLATVRMGKDLGVFVDPTQHGAGGPVTIVVNTHVPMPSRKEIEIHQEKMREKSEITISKKS